MNLYETNQLLVWLESADARHKPTGDVNTEAKVRVWAELLADVPIDFAHQHAKRFYAQAQPRDPMLTPGKIRSSWVTERDRLADQAVRAEAAASRRVAALPGTISTKAPSWFSEAVSRANAARRHGATEDEILAVIEKVKNDAGVFSRPPEPGTPETYARACSIALDCHCTHTECTKGWLDEETEIEGLLGGVYSQVRRCPVCTEAREMRAELTGSRGR